MSNVTMWAAYSAEMDAKMLKAATILHVAKRESEHGVQVEPTWISKLRLTLTLWTRARRRGFFFFQKFLSCAKPTHESVR